jgi:hypothetical protein
MPVSTTPAISSEFSGKQRESPPVNIGEESGYTLGGI